MDLAGVDLNLLVALDALLAERSVTRAAKRVGISQAGMSNALARLRRTFGDPLLVREGAALSPTARAEALRAPLHEALGLIRRTIDDRPGFDPARDRTTFTVSCSDYSLLMLVGPLVRRVGAEAPGVTIEVVPRSPDATRLLREGSVDLVIEPIEVMRATTLPARRLFADRWLCCIWDGNTEIGDRMTMETYLRLRHLVYSMGHGQPTSLVDEHLERSGVPRNIELTVESFLLAPFLVEGTNLVTLVPARAAPHLRRMAAIRLLEPPLPLPGFTEALWWQPRHTTDPAHAWMRDRIAEVAAGLDNDARP